MRQKGHQRTLGGLLGLLIWTWPIFSVEAPSSPRVARCELVGTVDSGSAAYLTDCIQRAEENAYQALFIRIDTPGGSLESTRVIVGAFLRSRVPILVWVGPSGAHAGSAGVFITLAAHIAAMAPGTNIGAAHPVEGMTGADPEAAGKQMGRKVENDAAAFAESIAHQRGRNEKWAIDAVRESASLAVDNAVKMKVVDFVAANEAEVLTKAHGRKVQLPQGEQVLQSEGAVLVSLNSTLGQRFVHLLASPALAYLLFLIGGFGLAIELSHPGMIVPGVLGLACMVLAMVAFSALPVRAGAVIMLLLGIGFIVGELFVGHGALALGGVVLLAVGGVLLIDRYKPGWFIEPSFGLTWGWVLPTVAALGGAAVFVVYRAAIARQLPQKGGDIGLVGEMGKALTPISPQGGEAFVHGERWRAVSQQHVPEGAMILVRSVQGLTVNVEEAKDAGSIGSG